MQELFSVTHPPATATSAGIFTNSLIFPRATKYSFSEKE
jgi:hypothetical protein